METAITSKLRKQRSRLHGIISQKQSLHYVSFLRKTSNLGRRKYETGLLLYALCLSTHTGGDTAEGHLPSNFDRSDVYAHQSRHYSIIHNER